MPKSQVLLSQSVFMNDKASDPPSHLGRREMGCCRYTIRVPWHHINDENVSRQARPLSFRFACLEQVQGFAASA